MSKLPLRLRRAGVSFLALAALGLATAENALAQLSAEDSVAKLRPASGFSTKLWAAEPQVINPTGIDVDSRGRVWVAEGLNYRPTRNVKLPRKPDADKIKILQDTDGDGRADKMTVFADNVFPVPMGIAVEERWGKDGKYQGARVFLGNSPDLLVLEDTDGDDKADKRYALLTGFGGVDSDHGVHGTALGPDGKLYFTHGDGCCTVEDGKDVGPRNFNVRDRSGRRVWSDQLANTLRVDRDGKHFEILADRQRNNYETCLNSFGNEFTSDNDDDGNQGSRVIWVMDGGHYGYRTPGSPRHWGEDVPGVVPKLVGTGNGSPCGVALYEGDLLPAKYRGAVFEAEAGPRVINAFPITRAGASFRTVHEVLLASDDPWFRPVDVCAMPDGSLLVADWYDAGVGGHAFSDQTTGRIYRITPEGSKPTTPTYDFATIPGLRDALDSPAVAARDAARRCLIERGDEAVPPLQKLMVATSDHGPTPEMRARALWTLAAIQGPAPALAALSDRDPRIREQAVRILGRDNSRNGHVEFDTPETRAKLAAVAHLEALRPLADDPDAGVRRELILAFRDVPTAEAGETLKVLARHWDGQDRWSLEALGLALERREPEFLASLFDGNLLGDLGLPGSGRSANVALPPYFPVDRNEAYLPTGSEPLPATALSKTVGLAWRLRRPESLPLLARIIPELESPEVQQAADDAVTQILDPRAAVTVAELALKAEDPLRRRTFLQALARRIGVEWNPARGEARVIEAIDHALADPVSRADGIAAAAATRDGRYAETLRQYARDSKATPEVRVAAVEALGTLGDPHSRETLETLVDEAHMANQSNPVAEAAVRALPKLGADQSFLGRIIDAHEMPLGIRREALRAFVLQDGGAAEVIRGAREGKLADDLKTEAAHLLATHRDPNLRREAASVLPQPKAASGRPLPPFFELVRREGDAARGREVFFRTGESSCASCHRVQGQGGRIGPDLSTIGVKSGKDELLRSILNPSAAIGYNFRSVVAALADGRVITGLAVEDTPDRLALKTADGKRVVLKPSEVEDRKVADVSLMPEGLVQAMTDDELVHVLAYLASLRKPISVVGQYRVIGPLVEGDLPAVDPAVAIDPEAKLPGADGREVSWRRLAADGDGTVDLGPLTGSDALKVAYLSIPVHSTVAQEARLVLETGATVRAWLDGRPIDLDGPSADGSPRIAVVHLPEGESRLLLRVADASDGSLVTTLVADRPVDFAAGSTSPASSR